MSCITLVRSLYSIACLLKITWDHGDLLGTLNILAQAGERGWLDYDGVVGRLRSETNFRTTLAVIEAARAAARSQ